MQSISQKTKSRKKKTLKGSIILWEFYEGELSKAIYSGEKVFAEYCPWKNVMTVKVWGDYPRVLV